MTCTGGKCSHKNSDKTQLYGEALVVGAALVPVWLAISMATTAMRLDFAGKPALDVFVSGFLFHLVAEETGVNTWFLTNSHASKKQFTDTIKGESHNALGASDSMDYKHLSSIVYHH